MVDPDSTPNAGPLADLKVVEAGQLLAGPFCGQLLADFGADVVKLEAPGLGDPMRQWGRGPVDGEGLWWPIVGRGKRSMTLDLRTATGQEIARRLLSDADVFVENFRPGTLERWGLGWEDLKQLNPRLVMVRVTAYGQTGPYSSRPGYGSIGEAMGGLRYITGDPSAPPSRTGISIGDSVAAMFGTLGALVALRAREHTGQGQVVDTALYESILALMESLLPEYTIKGLVRERTGSILPQVAPSNVYPTADGKMILIAANMDSVFRRLCEAMSRPELAEDPRYSSHTARGARQAELDDLISDWTRGLDAQKLLTLLDEHAVPTGLIYTAKEMLGDPHFAAREAIIQMLHPTLGEFPMQNVVPKLSATPGRVRSFGPNLGQHTEDVLRDLGYTTEEISALRESGTV